MSDSNSISKYFKPSSLLILFFLFVCRLIVLLPYRQILAVGKALGTLMYSIPSSRKAIASKNIAICFPEMPDDERWALLKSHLQSVAIGFLETAMMRWKSDKEIASLIRVSGLEHLQDAICKGKGVLLMSAHFTLIEIGLAIGKSSIVSDIPDLVVMYRADTNPLLNDFFETTRRKSARALVTKFEVKNLIKALKNKKIVWYAPDQDFTGNNALNVKFFNQDATITPAVIRFMAITGCTVLPFFPARLSGAEGYELTICPPIEKKAADGPEVFFSKFHAVLEGHIKKQPEQYYWVHRRFKSFIEY